MGRESNSWKWVNGHDVNFTYYVNGFDPDTASRDCMGTDPTEGQRWTDYRCSLTSHYLCQTERGKNKRGGSNKTGKTSVTLRVHMDP